MTQKPVNLPYSMEVASAALAERCYRDLEFAKRLRADPRAVIEETCGKKLPESLAIEVHENDGRTWHVSVPRGQAAGESSDKLSDEQLAAVSGCVFEIWISALVIGVVATTVVVGGGAVAGTAALAANA